jgi:hypothetical protein
MQKASGSWDLVAPLMDILKLDLQEMQKLAANDGIPPLFSLLSFLFSSFLFPLSSFLFPLSSFLVPLSSNSIYLQISNFRIFEFDCKIDTVLKREDVFATALAILFLTLKQSDKESEWTLVVEKGVKWLESVGVSVGKCDGVKKIVLDML